MTVIYERKEYKTILRKYKYIDSWFWCIKGMGNVNEEYEERVPDIISELGPEESHGGGEKVRLDDYV